MRRVCFRSLWLVAGIALAVGCDSAGWGLAYDAATAAVGEHASPESRSICAVSPAPKHEDFTCFFKFIGKPSAVDLTSHPRAITFRTELREQSAKPADFAGYYVAANWGCGSPCQEWALIDLRDGKVYFAPFTTALGGRYVVNSRLFIADAPEDIEEYYKEFQKSGVELPPPADRLFSPDYTTYWEWKEKEKRFLEIRKAK